MNPATMIQTLESRMQGIFEGANSVLPIRSDKLAKQALKCMKRGQSKVDGHLLAPTLYTISVNPEDDALIAPVYQEVAGELEDFLAHAALENGFELMGQPLVRFIPSSTLRQGKVDVRADIVTPEILEGLRREEEAYLTSRAERGKSQAQLQAQLQAQQPAWGQPQQAAPGWQAAAQQQAAQQQAPAWGQPQQQAAQQQAAAWAQPQQRAAAQQQAAPARQAAPVSQPAWMQQSAPQSDWGQFQSASRQAPVSQPAWMQQSPASQPLQGAQAARPAQAQAQAAQPAQAAQQARTAQPDARSCMLVDVSTGRIWSIDAGHAIIGREAQSADVLLDDTNVSRRHAELALTPEGWQVADLGSTNGTRVNGALVPQAILHNGDIVSMGLVSLRFQER